MSTSRNYQVCLCENRRLLTSSAVSGYHPIALSTDSCNTEDPLHTVRGSKSMAVALSLPCTAVRSPLLHSSCWSHHSWALSIGTCFCPSWELVLVHCVFSHSCTNAKTVSKQICWLKTHRKYQFVNFWDGGYIFNFRSTHLWFGKVFSAFY